MQLENGGVWQKLLSSRLNLNVEPSLKKAAWIMVASVLQFVAQSRSARQGSWAVLS